MKNIIRIVREYFFEFSAREANGFVILITLASILLIIPTVLRFFPQTASTPEELENDKTLTTQILTELAQAEKENQSHPQTKKYDYKKKQYKPVAPLFAFNPNKIGIEEWKKLGLKDYLAERIEKYKAKGGKFKYKSDLQKIYGFPDKLYEQLETHILLPEKFDAETNLIQNDLQNQENISWKSTKKLPENDSRSHAIEPFNINTADTATLRKVRGIGEVLAQRIVKFRDNLGGFHSLEQLGEVYGLKPETQTELFKYIRIQKSDYQKVKINTVSLDELKKHPYVRFKIAKIIINYRTQHGRYESVEDLKKIRVLDAEILEKITPYLSFE